MRGFRAASRLVRLRPRLGQGVGHAGSRPHGVRAPRIELPGQGQAAVRVVPVHSAGASVVGQGLRAGPGSGVGEYQEERGGLFRSRSDMEDALDFIGWYNHRLGASSASTGPMPTGSTLPTTRDGEGIGAVPGRRSPRCSATRNGSARLRSPTSRSSHAVKIASAATPGIRSGRLQLTGEGFRKAWFRQYRVRRGCPW